MHSWLNILLKWHTGIRFVSQIFPSLSRTEKFRVNIKHFVIETTIGKIAPLPLPLPQSLRT